MKTLIKQTTIALAAVSVLAASSVNFSTPAAAGGIGGGPGSFAPCTFLPGGCGGSGGGSGPGGSGPGTISPTPPGGGSGGGGGGGGGKKGGKRHNHGKYIGRGIAAGMIGAAIVGAVANSRSRKCWLEERRVKRGKRTYIKEVKVCDR